MENNFQRIYRYFQHLVNHKESDAWLMTSDLGNCVQYTGDLRFLETSYLRPGEAYLLEKRSNRELYCIGSAKEEMQEKGSILEQKAGEVTPSEFHFVLSSLSSEEKIKQWAFQQSGSLYFPPAKGYGTLRPSMDVLAKFGVLHHSTEGSEHLYRVTFPQEIEKMSVSITPLGKISLNKDTEEARDWASILELLVD